MHKVKVLFAEEQRMDERCGETVWVPVFFDWLESPRHAPERLREVIDFEISDPNEDRLAVAEMVYAITNSYPEEMHCPEKYREVVKTYRASKLRSLSVGDVVEVDGVRLIVAFFGFKEIPSDVEVAA
jgi:hypothetical protein